MTNWNGWFQQKNQGQRHVESSDIRVAMIDARDWSDPCEYIFSGWW